ncbi:hypothetical protein STEG23_037885, partial [Scotinomys teguina]
MAKGNPEKVGRTHATRKQATVAKTRELGGKVTHAATVQMEQGTGGAGPRRHSAREKEEDQRDPRSQKQDL